MNYNEELWGELAAESRSRRTMLEDLRKQRAQIEAQAAELRQLQERVAWLEHDLGEKLDAITVRAAIVVN